MNATTTVSAMTKMTTLLEGLEQRLNKMEQTCYQTQHTNQNNTRTTTTTNQDNPNYNIPPWKRTGSKLMYCWSFGCQKTHSGAQCTRKKTNHIDIATFDNRQGGSYRGIAVRFC